jgi:Leu/Phe-tRNA-protein transferase
VANCTTRVIRLFDTHLENNHFESLKVCKEERVFFSQILCIKNFQSGG